MPNGILPTGKCQTGHLPNETFSLQKNAQQAFFPNSKSPTTIMPYDHNAHLSNTQPIQLNLCPRNQRMMNTPRTQSAHRSLAIAQYNDLFNDADSISDRESDNSTAELDEEEEIIELDDHVSTGDLKSSARKKVRWS